MTPRGPPINLITAASAAPILCNKVFAHKANDPPILMVLTRQFPLNAEALVINIDDTTILLGITFLQHTVANIDFDKHIITFPDKTIVHLNSSLPIPLTPTIQQYHLGNKIQQN